MDENFFLGYRKTAVKDDEVLVSVLFPFTAKVGGVISVLLPFSAKIY